jgi:hypothetical protein
VPTPRCAWSSVADAAMRAGAGVESVRSRPGALPHWLRG